MVNVLFVCIGNSCRSQMAEGFARKYGADVMYPMSAGLAPALIVQPSTIETMLEKNIDIQDQFPKSVHEMELNSFDVIVNMSGQPMATGVRAEVLSWDITDPMLASPEVYIAVRERIESLVMKLILDLRRSLRQPPLAPPVPAPPTEALIKTSNSSQRFGFGRVRKNRD